MSIKYLVLDLATAPIDGAASFMDEPSAPANYKDPEKIAAYIAEKKAEGAERCGLDLDLCRITAVGEWPCGGEPTVTLCKTEDEERAVLDRIRHFVAYTSETRVITYNGFRFDMPVLARRCAYLRLPVPKINLDRFRSPHIDVYDYLTNHGATNGHPLGFYTSRHQWTDIAKPLTGQQESQVHVNGRWDELTESVRHDVIACDRVARFYGAI